MEHTYQYSWIIPALTLLVPMLLGLGLLLFPSAIRKRRRAWSFTSVLFLSIVMIFSIDPFIRQINNGSIYQYLWSWTINNDFSLEFGYLIDPLTSILSILITTVGILVLIYSDNYMSHDQGYLRFFAYMSFFNNLMLTLVSSSNLIQIYIFWELVGMCSYLLIGFWFVRPIASNACQKAFLTNRVGDFGLLLGILGFYWLTGSFEFRDLFEIVNNLTNEVNPLFVTFCALLLFSGPIAKSAQFPLHVWLPDAMEGPTPISALIHAATMVAAGIFLVARLLPLFLVIPYIMNLIAVVGIITVLLGATLALAQKDIKRSLAYSTMSQLGYMMLALGMGSYRAALFHLITHAYSKALLFLGSGSIIHSMENIVGYSPDKSQNMVLMGGLRKHIPITQVLFLLGTLSLCGIPPLACFWSKDEILNASWFYSPSFAIIACSTAGLTAFYMFRVYLLTFEGHFNVHFQNYSGKKNSSFYSISLWGNEKKNVKKKGSFSYPQESDKTMLFPLLVLGLFTLFIEIIGIPFNQLNQEGINLDILSKSLTGALNFFDDNEKLYWNWLEFIANATFSVSIACFGIFLAASLYKPVYSSFQNLNFLNSFYKKGLKRFRRDRVLHAIYDWSYNRGYIDIFYTKSLSKTIRVFAKLTDFFDRHIIDGIPNGVAFTSFFLGEGIKYLGGGRLSSYLLLYLFNVLILLILYLLIYYFF
ncbi:NAD(P)H-quinone oxidoreductase subunit 5, chloroplastic [Linum perenne]